MDLREIDASGPFKRSTRMPLDAVVRLHFEGTVAYQNGFAANVSATGMFVKHPDPPGLGTRLVFEFVIGEQRKPVQGAGVVAWVRERYEGPGRPAGIGIQFTEVDAQSRQHLAEALFEFLELSLGGEAFEPFETDSEPVAAKGRSLEPLPPELEANLAPATAPEPDPAPAARPAPSFAMATPSEGVEPPVDYSPAIPPEPAPPAAPDRRATFSYAPAGPAPEPEPAPAESEEERIDRLVRAALADEPLAGAASVRSRGLPLWVWMVAGLVLLGAGWATWRYRIAPAPPSARAAAPAPAPTATPRPPLPAVGEPKTTLADAVGATDAARTAPEIPLPRGVAPAADESDDEGPPDAAVATPDAAAPAATAPPPDAPIPAPSPAPADAGRAAAAVEPLAIEPGQPHARAVSDIDWTEATGITVVTLAGDGPFAAGTYSYSEIGGDKPRVLVRFKGLERPFRQTSLAVGTAAVAGIRTGWHDRPGGFEQHVVIDLTGANVRLEGFEALGSRIVLKLAPR